MSLLQTIKAASLQARKERRTADAASLQTLIGEAEAIGKNAGNRETTDVEVVAVIKKFIKNLDELIMALRPGESDIAIEQSTAEKAMLAAFLPKQLTTEELTHVIASIKVEISAGPKDMGKILKLVKERFEGQYDGAAASTITKAALT